MSKILFFDHEFDDVLVCASMKDESRFCNNSMALHTGEDRKSIISNRMRFFDCIDPKGDMRFVFMNQTHSDHVVSIEPYETKERWTETDRKGGIDAMIYKGDGVGLCVLSADCVPILLYDRSNKTIGAIHAGWKGASSGIIAKTINQMKIDFGTNPQALYAFIGASIRGCCYEVDQKVTGAFDFLPNDVVRPSGVVGKWMLDMPRLASYLLRKEGVKKDRIVFPGWCSRCDERFFSYRENGTKGRLVTLIGLLR